MADKKPDKKEEKKPSGGGHDPLHMMLYWVVGVCIFLTFFIQNWDNKFIDLSSTPVEDPETGRVIGVDNTFKFPIGNIRIGDKVILKEDAFVRSAPAQARLGKQLRYETAIVQEGPLQAYNQSWWRLNFENAPDGWVPEYSVTRYVLTYEILHIIPITWKYIKPILWIAGIIFFILYLAAFFRLKALRAEAEEKLKPKTKPQDPILPHVSANHIVVGKEEEQLITAGDRRSNDRWLHILQLMQSYNQNDWRQAVIEADIILEEMLEKMGYDGVTIGDKLKNVEPSDFRTLNQAWEAHKVRNRIAHMGSEFQISRDEVERVINLYQEVFEEFYYI